MNKEQASRTNLIDAELFISYSLRVGVYSSAVVVTLGLALLFIRGNSGYPIDVFPTSISALWSGILMFKASAIITLGLVFLIITPVFRVAASFFLFLIEKDHSFAIITLFVLAVLIVSFVIGSSMQSPI